MESNTLLAVFLVGLLTTASCQPPQPPVYQQEVDPSSAGDRQLVATLLGLITPALTSVITLGATNLFMAFYNAISASFAGKTLEMIPLERLLATPIRETVPTAAPAPAPAHPHTQGEPAKRRPFTRAMNLDEETPLQSSEPETVSAAAAAASF